MVPKFYFQMVTRKPGDAGRHLLRIAIPVDLANWGEDDPDSDPESAVETKLREGGEGYA